mgnify:CR=1 FL=1
MRRKRNDIVNAIHKKLDKLLVENPNEVLAMYNRGIKLTFTDITAINNYGKRVEKVEKTSLLMEIL